MTLSDRGRTALYIGGGLFLGLAVGALIVDPRLAVDLSPFWGILLALYLAGVVVLSRQRGAAAPAPERGAFSVPVKAAVPRPPGSIEVAVTLADLPPGFPAVSGRGDPLTVRIVAKRLGVPVEGCAILMRARQGGETLEGDGLTGTEGAVEFTLEPEAAGELLLEVDARTGDLVGHGDLAVSLVNYDEEIARLFSEFRAFAVSVLGPDAEADTARELAERLRGRVDAKASRALLELARIYELVAYGERRADRRLYFAVMEQLLILEHADLPTPAQTVREA